MENKIEEKKLVIEYTEVEIDDFLRKSGIFFDKFRNKHIGVQLSGGVDSSLIIGLLNYFGIRHSLVGLFTKRYEFRTESFIQNLIAEKSINPNFINHEEHLPYSGLGSVPPHQHPDASCCNFNANQAMASVCNENKIDILLTGSGGDLALGDNVHNAKCQWIPAIFNDTWLQDLVYTPKGTVVLSFFSDPDILGCIWNLRRGQKTDPKKIWARNFFRDFLPKELVDFTYKADFWGLYIDGLLNSLPEIRSIHKKAFDISGNPYFEVANFNEIFKNDLLNCDQVLYQRIEARISAAIWINSLSENK
jgi:hypothetical protein